MPSFDIISKVDFQEVNNAVNQAMKEIGARYDFRGSKSKVELVDNKEIQIIAEDDYKLGAIKDILQTKLHRRGVDIKSLKFGKAIEAGGMLLKQQVEIQQGVDRDTAKKIMKAIKDAKLKVQAQINDDKIKVSSKSIDSLQEVIGQIVKLDFGIPLQTENMRS